MALPVLKASVCVAGLASCAGLGVFASKTFFSNKEGEKSSTSPKVKDLLKERGYSVMTSGSSGWSEILSAYKDPKNNGVVKFGSSDGVSEEDLKRECTFALDDTLTDSYEKAKRWCVEPKKVSGKLEELKLTPLKIADEEGQNDSDSWKKLETEYAKQKVEGIVGLNPVSPVTTTSWQGLRNECKKFFDFKPWDDGYDNSLRLSKKWCVSQVIPS